MKKKNIKNLVIIPARAGSQRIKNKNIKIFNGMPMIAWTIKKLIKSNIFDKIIVTTDSAKIAKIAKKYGIQKIIKRPKILADSKASTISVIKHAIKFLEQENYLLKNIFCIYPCTPLLKISYLKNALVMQRKNKFMFPIIQYSHPIQRALKIQKGNQIEFVSKKYENYRTQDLMKTYHDSGQFYLADRKTWIKKRNILSNGIGIPVNSSSLIDIDTYNEWKLAEIIHKNTFNQKR